MQSVKKLLLSNINHIGYVMNMARKKANSIQDTRTHKHTFTQEFSYTHTHDRKWYMHALILVYCLVLAGFREGGREGGVCCEERWREQWGGVSERESSRNHKMWQIPIKVSIENEGISWQPSIVSLVSLCCVFVCVLESLIVNILKEAELRLSSDQYLALRREDI